VRRKTFEKKIPAKEKTKIRKPLTIPGTAQGIMTVQLKRGGRWKNATVNLLVGRGSRTLGGGGSETAVARWWGRKNKERVRDVVNQSK